MTNFRIKVAESWNKLGIKTDDPNYELKYLNFLETIFYADQIQQYTNDIGQIVIELDMVRRAAYTPAQQKLLAALLELAETKKIARPKNARIEKSLKDVNEFTWARPDYRSEALCDVSPSSFAVGDLTNFLSKRGFREITIDKNSTVTVQHDKVWSGGANASYSFTFFSIGGGGGGSGESHYSRSVATTQSLGLSFENISEVFVDRDLWFDPSLFKDPELKKILDPIPGTDRLAYVSVSLVIARGLKITLNFSETVTETEWSRETFGGRGGFSLFGFGFGGGGSSSRYDYRSEVSTDKKSVTFSDDPMYARLLAVRVEQFVDKPAKKPGLLPQFLASAPEAKALQAMLHSGVISYADFQKSKIAMIEK